MIIALDCEECLLHLGASKVAVHATATGALAALNEDSFDMALLDCNLGSESSEPVAARLRALGIPFWLATGYGEMAAQAAGLGAAGVLVKPYGEAELAAVLGEFSAMRA